MRGPVLRGGIARLRPIEARDADRMWEAAQDPEGLRMTGTTESFTRSQIDEWCATIADRPGRYDWAIVPAAKRDGKLISNEMIGEVVLKEIDTHARSANLRIALASDYRGRGYGRDAIEQVLRYAFDGARDQDGEFDEGPQLHRVSLDYLAFNTRAKALYESMGFVEEGRLRDAHRDGSAYVDVVLMAILEDDYHARR